MSDAEDLAADLKRANAASPSTRIEHRDKLAAHGVAIVPPLLGWVRDGKHAHFVIRVYEALAVTELDAAMAALGEVRKANPALATEVSMARQRLTGPTVSVAQAAKPRGTGVLDQVTPFGPPADSGPCMGLTKKGEPCRNLGRYWVGDKLSCSRVHAEYQ